MLVSGVLDERFCPLNPGFVSVVDNIWITFCYFGEIDPILTKFVVKRFSVPNQARAQMFDTRCIVLS